MGGKRRERFLIGLAILIGAGVLGYIYVVEPLRDWKESMAEVINNTTSQLTPQDLAALIAYLRALPPLPD